MGIYGLFFELIQAAVGTSASLSVVPKEEQWQQLFAMAKKQMVAGMLFPDVERIYKESKKGSGLPAWLLQWFAYKQSCVQGNALQCQRAKELTDIFHRDGFRACVLKGVGLGQIYDQPELRQPGDIDIWVDADRDEVVSYLKKHWKIGHPTIHHVDADIFKDVPVEVHYLPAWLYNPVANRKLQVFFEENKDVQFANITQDGFVTPTIAFNLVYCLIHNYKHQFEENVTYKQLMDYFYLLKKSTKDERVKAMDIIRPVGLAGYAAYLMWQMKDIFAIDDDFLLCQPSSVCRRPWKETVCLYPWKVWHWCWRKWKGFI